jgi:hypothetical protein
MVACLLSLGVDANVEGDNGTALQVAEKAGFENVCKILTGTHTHTHTPILPSAATTVVMNVVK